MCMTLGEQEDRHEWRQSPGGGDAGGEVKVKDEKGKQG